MQKIGLKIKQFEDSGWGVILRYAIITLITVVIILADARYLTTDEAERQKKEMLEHLAQKEEQLHRVRSEDLNMILNRMKDISRQATSNAALNASVDNRLNRIEAQTEIILKYIQRQDK